LPCQALRLEMHAALQVLQRIGSGQRYHDITELAGFGAEHSTLIS
jgi:hypothetical protein